MSTVLLLLAGTALGVFLFSVLMPKPKLEVKRFGRADADKLLDRWANRSAEVLEVLVEGALAGAQLAGAENKVPAEVSDETGRIAQANHDRAEDIAVNEQEIAELQLETARKIAALAAQKAAWAARIESEDARSDELNRRYALFVR